ncbi:ribosome silencing factor [Gammaproteobacteria bacterium]|nr:ribosome silencing factor [Gammaproteobacteria bacterium]
MSNQIVEEIKSLLEEHKAKSILVINTEGKTIICDHMVLATVDHEKQMQFIAQTLLRAFKSIRQNPEPHSDDQWALIDLGDTIVHLMTEDARSTINLEEIWANR